MVIKHVQILQMLILREKAKRGKENVNTLLLQ